MSSGVVTSFIVFSALYLPGLLIFLKAVYLCAIYIGVGSRNQYWGDIAFYTVGRDVCCRQYWNVLCQTVTFDSTYLQFVTLYIPENSTAQLKCGCRKIVCYKMQ